MPRFCVDCKHFQRAERAHTEDEAFRWGLCLKDKQSEQDLVSGERRPEYLTASCQRKLVLSGCGPTGQWWEAKDTRFGIDKLIGDLRGEMGPNTEKGGTN